MHGIECQYVLSLSLQKADKILSKSSGTFSVLLHVLQSPLKAFVIARLFLLLLPPLEITVVRTYSEYRTVSAEKIRPPVL